jgi:hypothetical protein
VSGKVQVPAGIDRVLAQRRMWLARAHFAAGDRGRAAAVAQELASAPADYKLEAVGLLARIAGAERGAAGDAAARAAVAFLRELREADPAQVVRDADSLVPLRGRDDFEALFR